MTLEIHRTGAFKRDQKRLMRQGGNMAELFAVVECLAQERPLAARYRDHALTGNWTRHRECHIRPDWLLIYRVADGTLYLERTGSHAELFD